MLRRLASRGLLGADCVLIAEKPTAAKALALYLGTPGAARLPAVTGHGVVITAQGHLYRELMPEEIDPRLEKWRPDTLPIDPDAWPRTAERATRHLISTARDALKRARLVWIATDFDRAGEVIARDLLDDLHWRGPVQRLPLTGLDSKSIEDAFERVAEGGLVAAAVEAWAVEERCRAEVDIRLGTNASRAGSLLLRPSGIDTVWSAGGVQAPTVALIGTREREIARFVPTAFYDIAMDVQFAEQGDRRGPSCAALRLEHAPSPRLTARPEAERIAALAAAWRGEVVIASTEKPVQPPNFFGADTFQAAAVRSLGMSQAAAMDAAQALYDRGLVSYVRSVSEVLPVTQAERASAMVPELAARYGVPDGLRRAIIRSKTHFVRVDDPRLAPHHAIVPTRAPGSGDALQGQLAAVYDLIARRFLAGMLAAGRDALTKVTVHVKDDQAKDGTRAFTAEGRTVLEIGWRVLEPWRIGKDPRLPVIEDRRGYAASASVLDKMTEPPRPIGFAELPVKMGRLIDAVPEALKPALETDDPTKPRGLGTAATRADIIEKIISGRSYVEIRREGKPLSAGELAAIFTKRGSSGRGHSAGGGARGGGGGSGRPEKGALTLHLTPNGWAYLEAWEQADPWLVDICGRAELEEELHRIGGAGSRARAEGLAREFLARYRGRLTEMIHRAKAAPRGSLPPAGPAGRQPRLADANVTAPGSPSARTGDSGSSTGSGLRERLRARAAKRSGPGRNAAAEPEAIAEGASDGLRNPSAASAVRLRRRFQPK